MSVCGWVTLSVALGLWQCSTLRWEYVTEETAHLREAGRQRERGQGWGPNSPFKDRVTQLPPTGPTS